MVPRDLSFRGVAEKLLHALTSIDARVLHTLSCLLRHPGALTMAWTRGTRREYVAPFQLFLIANLIFFMLQALTGTNIFSSPLGSHLQQQDWKQLAQVLLTERLQATGRTLTDYAPVFDRAVVLNAKSLIVLMTMPFALVLPLAFFRERRPFMVHLVFSLHLYTFMLLVFCIALVGAKVSAMFGGGGLDSPLVDTVLSVINLVCCALYLYFAMGTVYGARGIVGAAKAAALALAVGGIVLAYRFALFLITLYGT